MTEQKLSAGIEISKMEKGQWSFGVCFSHYFDETYLYINLIKWTITIGKFWKQIRRNRNDTRNQILKD